MCIRDRGEEGRLGRHQHEERLEVHLRVSDQPAIQPVSYTHLDVYKRQFMLIADIDTPRHGIIPVSYTHLDVYKRQGVIRTIPK